MKHTDMIVNRDSVLKSTDFPDKIQSCIITPYRFGPGWATPSSDTIWISPSTTILNNNKKTLTVETVENGHIVVFNSKTYVVTDNLGEFVSKLVDNKVP